MPFQENEYIFCTLSFLKSEYYFVLNIIISDLILQVW